MGLYDDVSVSLATSYVSKEYSILWDKYPWSDTLTNVQVSIPAGQGTVSYPAGIDRIVTVRATNHTSSSGADSRFIDPVTSTFLVETDPAIFERTGFVQYYEENTDTATGAKRLQLYPTPALDTSLFIVGKAKFPGDPGFGSSSYLIIRNIDQAVTAYATADMLRRQRQYGKAEVEYKKGQELEANAWAVEQQQANQPRRTKATTVAGNSLAEMTDAVCMLCGQWTPEYRLVIREFLRRNYQLLYDSFLWPESLVMVRVPYATEQVIMPGYIDKVLGVRGTNDLRMFPADAGLILDITPSAFDEIGTPISYTSLTPVGVSTLPTALTQLVLASDSAVDTSSVTLRGEQIAGGVILEETVYLNGTASVTSNFAYDIPITFAKDITVGNVTCNAANDGLLLEHLTPGMREQKHQRLWFLPAPDNSTLGAGGSFTCLVLGKRDIHPLLTDQDTPIITGVQQVLVAAAAADLFRKLEKPDLATAMQQKADGSMAVLKAKNTDQAASAPRFVPQPEAHAYVAGVGAW
jgi:hypothetical protein